MYMLVRNKVRDFDKWKQVFDEQSSATDAAQLKLVKMWCSVEDPNGVFFMLEIGDMDKAKAFVADPKNAEVGERAGVIDGEIYYVEEV